MITRLPTATPSNDLTTSSDPHPPHLTVLDNIVHDAHLVTSPNLCLRCSITATFDCHLSTVSQYAIAIDAVEREYKSAADNVGSDGSRLAGSEEQQAGLESKLRDEIINRGLRKVLELQEDCAIEVEDMWGGSRFAWDGATHCFFSDDKVETSTIGESRADAKGRYTVDKPKYRGDGEPEEERDLTELKQQLLRVHTERAHDGELVRVVMVWKEWKPKDPIGKDRMRQGKFVEAWREDIRLISNQDVLVTRAE